MLVSYPLHPDLTFIEVPFDYIGGVYDYNSPISDNFTFQELFDSVKVLPSEEAYLIEQGIPLHRNSITVAQTVRDYTGNPVYIGSSFRSRAWEKSKKRRTDGAHPRGLAIDLNGEGVFDLLWTAYHEKNELYQKLKNLGVTSYGFYDWGVHLDFRDRKANGKDRFWDYREKKK